MSDLQERLAEALAEHVYLSSDEEKIDDEWAWGFHCECGDFVPDADANAHLAAALLPIVNEAVRQARFDSLAISAAALRHVVDYWDGRPTEHHGHHIEADLRDVLRAIEADRDYNAVPTGAEGDE